LRRQCRSKTSFPLTPRRCLQPPDSPRLLQLRSRSQHCSLGFHHPVVPVSGSMPVDTRDNSPPRVLRPLCRSFLRWPRRTLHRRRRPCPVQRGQSSPRPVPPTRRPFRDHHASRARRLLQRTAMVPMPVPAIRRLLPITTSSSTSPPKTFLTSLPALRAPPSTSSSVPPGRSTISPLSELRLPTLRKATFHLLPPASLGPTAVRSGLASMGGTSIEIPQRLFAS
jgi:hypothetical protein